MRPTYPAVSPPAQTLEECWREMREAMAFHIEGLRLSGQPVPEPSGVTATYVDVAA